MKRIILGIGAAAFSYEISKPIENDQAIHVLSWIGLAAFCFWKAWTAPKKWSVRLGVAFSVIIPLQLATTASYLKKTGDVRFWSVLLPMVAPLFVVALCFYALRVIKDAEQA